MLPAEANYEDSSHHLFEILSDIGDKVPRILMKFSNDVDTVSTKNGNKAALIDAVSDQIRIRQCEKWYAIEEEFITEVLTLLEVFAQVMVELLENENYMSVEHVQIREELAKQLLGFTETLSMVKSHFLSWRRSEQRRRQGLSRPSKRWIYLLTLDGLLADSRAFTRRR
ncbi:hypothetical protein BU25DRAFT_490149 [Macroventuria anomochaeta]|uniref:Uncharacterized protein n=1 Tax=Macroventuria anomochaeta TaxID=301207 RepID=A0ACB6S4D5_9PLEO|nr:uncharacterized protein BU25DRAFT_490149 [Macroventuria anomochaeta]KAF2629021.1 hypothetical protein BU25DRAFT_490149 [Macroventuria anomochaeta]